jgi:thiol-disulfide isomerase/thioredoxin
MKKKLIILLFLGISSYAKCQLHISGRILPSKQWSNALYVIRMDHIDAQPNPLIDSVLLSEDGYFNYSFTDSSQGSLYKVILPPNWGNFRTSISGHNDNYFFLSTEESDSLELTADADSLYYSLKIKGGTVNKALLVYRDYSRPLYNLSCAHEDSMSSNPNQEEKYRKRTLTLWMEEIEELKRKVSGTLDTASSASLTMAGLYYLNQTHFGILPGDMIKKYLPKISHLDIPLVKNTIELAGSVETNRLGMVLPDIEFRDSGGKLHSLHEVAKKVTVLDFWASWCNPCRQANKTTLPELHESFNTDSEKLLISISIDNDQDKWKKAVADDALMWPQYIDEDRIFVEMLSVYAVPLYLVLDAEKKIIYETISAYHLSQFISNLDKE